MLGSCSVNMKLDLIFELGSNILEFEKICQIHNNPMVYKFEESGQTCT